MTIRVEKPAFNLRSKLNALDFGQVPDQKMPAGSILQVKSLELIQSSQALTVAVNMLM